MHFEHLFKTLDMPLCFFAMRRKGLLQFGHLGRLHHLGESAEDLLFRVVDILQLRQKQVAQCFLNHGNLLVMEGRAR